MHILVGEQDITEPYWDVPALKARNFAVKRTDRVSGCIRLLMLPRPALRCAVVPEHFSDGAGIDALKAMQKAPVKTPTLFVCPPDARELRVQALELGADKLLEDSASIYLLIAEIEALLRCRQSATGL